MERWKHKLVIKITYYVMLTKKMHFLN